MDTACRRVHQDFSGDVRQEEHEQQHWSLFEKKTQKVQDIYTDFHFKPDESSWVTGGSIDSVSDVSTMPAAWNRLVKYTVSAPYPIPSAYDPNPRSGRVYQGALKDFYLVQALHTLGMKASLIRDMFVDMEYSNPQLGCFIIRFYKHAQWLHVEIDDLLPCDKEDNPICIISEHYPALSWPSLIHKAYSKP